MNGFSFTALSGSALAAALLGAVALTFVLYLLRLRRRPVLVPFVELWSHLILEKKATAWRSALRRWLSLLLSLCLIIALVLAFSNPVMEGERKGRHLVVLIDAGATMGEPLVGGDAGKAGDTGKEKTRISRARQVVTEWSQGLGPKDSMLLVAMGARPRPLESFTKDPVALTDALVELHAEDVRPDLSAGLALAHDALRGQSSPEIIVVSDGALIDTLPATSKDKIPLRFFDVTEPQNAAAPGQSKPAKNLGESKTVGAPGAPSKEASAPEIGISAFAARRHPLSDDRFEVLLSIFSTSDVPVAAEVSIYAAEEDGARGPILEARRLQIEGDQKLTFSNLSQAEQGLIAELRILTEGQDTFFGDNVARAVMPKRAPVKVLVVGPLDTFLEASLLIESSLVVKTSDLSSYPPDEDFDVTIFNGVATKRDRRTGAAIYLGAPSPDQTEFYPVDVGKELKLFGFDTWNKTSSVFRFIDPYDVQVLRGFRLEPRVKDQRPADEVLGKSGQDPIFVSGLRPEGAFLALGFSPIESDFVLRPMWPLFVLNLIDTLHPRGRGQPLSAFSTGQTVRVQVLDPGVSSATLRGPLLGAGDAEANDPATASSSTPASLPVRTTAAERVIPVVSGHAVFFAERAGFYDLATPSGTVRVATSLYEGARQRPVAQSEQAPPEVERAGPVEGLEPKPRYDVWYWLVFFVLVVSTVEWWTFHRRWTV